MYQSSPTLEPLSEQECQGILMLSVSAVVHTDEVANFEGNIEDLEAEDFATVDLSAAR